MILRHKNRRKTKKTKQGYNETENNVPNALRVIISKYRANNTAAADYVSDDS